MGDEHLFISYSRVQLNFVRQLVKALQDTHLNIWFDLQRLTPGVNWQQGIEDGLRTCRGLILVASQTALASPYVQREWEAALTGGKLVYVVLWEAVSLPEALAQVPVFDLTVQFDAGVQRLTDCLRTQRCTSDPQRRQWPLNIPQALPIEVQTVATAFSLLGLSILLPFVAVLLGADKDAQQWMLAQPLVPTGLLMIGNSFMLARWYLVRHRLAPLLTTGIGNVILFGAMLIGVAAIGLAGVLSSLWLFAVYLPVFVIWMVIFAVGHKIPFMVSRKIMDWTGILAVVATGVVLLVMPIFWKVPLVWHVGGLLLVASASWSFWKLSSIFRWDRMSPEMQRWLSQGLDSDEVPVSRSKKGALALGYKVPQIPYQLHYAPSDEKLASSIRDILSLPILDNACTIPIESTLRDCAMDFLLYLLGFGATGLRIIPALPKSHCEKPRQIILMEISLHLIRH